VCFCVCGKFNDPSNLGNNLHIENKSFVQYLITHTNNINQKICFKTSNTVFVGLICSKLKSRS